ncbi:hypothetical protein ACK1MO_004261 [Salmonella enterica]
MAPRNRNQLKGSVRNGIPKTEQPQQKERSNNISEKKTLTNTDKFNIWKKIRENAYNEKKEYWNKYDTFILQSMSEMNNYLSRYPAYVRLDWLWIKAMLWTEGDADGHKNEWEHRPLRIGVPGDKGGPAVIAKSEAVGLIIPPGSAWQGITSSNMVSDPHMNIRAAIIYLMNRLSKSDIVSVDDPKDKTDYTVKISSVEHHGTLDAIAKDEERIGTTMDILKRENPGLDPRKIHSGEEIRYRKGSMKRVITGWLFPVTAQIIAEKYNGGGDSMYAEKLSYVHSLFSSTTGNKNK